jgi:hypothetical protein
MSKDLILNFGLGAYGETDVTLIDSDGNIKFNQHKRNMLVNGFADHAFQSNYSLLSQITDFRNAISYGAMKECRIGTDNTPTIVTDANIKGTLIATKAATNTDGNYSYPASGLPCYMEFKYVFGNDVSGSIGEMAIFDGDGRMIARQVADVVLNKELSDTFVIVWRITVTSPEVMSGVLAGGNADGSDVTWKWFITNATLRNICFGKSATYSFTGNAQYYYGAYMCDYPSNMQYIFVGDSNLDSIAATDGPCVLKGNNLSSTFYNRLYSDKMYWAPYVSGNGYRDLVLNISSEITSSIGELYTGTSNSAGTASSRGRITFTPALQKSSTNTLTLVLRHGLNINV